MRHHDCLSKPTMQCNMAPAFVNPNALTRQAQIVRKFQDIFLRATLVFVPCHLQKGSI